MSYTHTTLVGYLGQDAQVRTLDGGRVVTSFSVAYTETWKTPAGEKQERTTWFNCSYFTAQAPGVAAYLLKGALVAVAGRVGARAYLDQRQQPASSLELNVSEVRLLSTPKREEQPTTTPMPHPDTVLGQAPASTTNTALGDDLPF